MAASLKEHAGFAALVGGAVIAVGIGLFAFGGAEVAGTTHAATSNGWVQVGLWVLLFGIAILIVATVVYVMGARKSAAPIALSISPNPVTALHWEDGDYRPTHSKAWPGPKVFKGTVDPCTVPGVVVNEYDEWINPDAK